MLISKCYCRLSLSLKKRRLSYSTGCLGTTFGGSHNVGIALYNGGTIYIDDGKPVAGKFDETIRNLKEISPTVYLNVPKGWEELTEALEKDEELRDRFLPKLKFYSLPVLHFQKRAGTGSTKLLSNIAEKNPYYERIGHD